MKKYFKSSGWKESKSNDVLDKEFYLEEVNFEQSLETRFNNVILDRTETYSLFLKTFDSQTFKTKIEGIINSALSDGVNIVENPSINALREENGYRLTLIFNIKG